MRFSLSIFILSAIAANIFSQQKPDAELNSLIAAEYAFAKSASEIGTRDAFLKFIADDGILFRPGPVNGKKFLEGSPQKAGLLSWYPAAAEISKDCGMGFTTGPAEFSNSKNDEPVWFGNFCTVWQRQDNGSWKFVIDFGNSNEKPKWKLKGLNFYNANNDKLNSSVRKQESSPDELRSLENKIDRELKLRGAAATYVKYVNAGSRLLRNGYLPVDGAENIIAFLKGEKSEMNFQFEGGKIASSNDIGFTYGKLELSGSDENKSETCNYLRIYKKFGTHWKIAVEAIDKK